MIPLEITPDEAAVLAQFCKRLCWSDYKNCAASTSETYCMQAVMSGIESQLNKAGFNPR